MYVQYKYVHMYVCIIYTPHTYMHAHMYMDACTPLPHTHMYMRAFSKRTRIQM